MSLTRQAMEQTARRCWNFYRDSVQFDYAVHPTDLAAPVRRLFAHPTNHGDSAPLVCAVKKDSSAEFALGPETRDKYGPYHPLLIKGNWEVLFPSRKSMCNLIQYPAEKGEVNGHQFYRATYRYEFKQGETTKAIYNIEWEARWGYASNPAGSNVQITVRKISCDDDTVVVWVPNRIVDDVVGPHWTASRVADGAAFISPGYVSQGHLFSWKSLLMRNGAHYFGNNPLWSPVEYPYLRDLDGGVAIMNAFIRYFGKNLGTTWTPLIGMTDKGSEFEYPGSDDGHYIHHHNAHHGELALANDPPDSLTFKKYFSRSFTPLSKKVYFHTIFPQSPYNYSLEAVDRCLRYGPEGLDGDDGSLAWLDRCGLEGNGIRILRDFPIAGLQDGQGLKREHLALKADHPLPVVPPDSPSAGFLDSLPYKRGHTHIESLPPAVPFMGSIPTPLVEGFHEAYSSNWLAIFCYAATICYQYARNAGHPRTRDLANYAKQSAELLIRLQFTGETSQLEDELDHGNLLAVPTVCSFGAFPFGYNFDSDGIPYGLGVVTELQSLFEGTMRLITPYDQQDPFPVVKGFGETVWLVLGAFLNMLATDLV